MSTKQATTTSQTPMVVQGVAAAPVGSLQIDGNDELEVPFLRGEVQPPAYRDVAFAYAFVAQIVGVVLTAALYGPAIFQETPGDDTESSGGSSAAYGGDQNTSDDGDLGFGPGQFFVVLAASFVAAILTTMGLLSVMMKYSHAVVQISFLSAPILLFAVSIPFMAIDAQSGAILLGGAFFFAMVSALVYLCYRRFVPFAASTLRTALSAIRYHQGLYLLSFGGLILSFIVSTVFFISFAGIFASADQWGEVPCKDLYNDVNNDMFDDNEMCLKDPPNTFAILLLILSLFWTQQVIQNVLHCTTAGAVGTWWFSGLGDPSCCSRDITDSFGRATTYSFGSICFGSLLVAIIQTLEEMAKSSRRNRRGGALLACILECILLCLRAWLEYFNSWAFCYVGLYGYGYLTAGKNVIQLFRSRGWSTFASDRLIFRVLYASQLTVALVSGGIAGLVDAIGSPMFTNDATSSHVLSFLTGFVFGLILSKCSLFVVESAVRTVIVCFAENPADFKEHHPELCQEMRDGWAAAYPEVWTDDYDLRFSEVIMSAEGAEEKESLMV
jgi:hypothetical protein